MTMTADKAAAAQPVVEKTDATVIDKPEAERPGLAHDKRKALGRGLESLLPGPRLAGSAAAATGAAGIAARSPAPPAAGTIPGVGVNASAGASGPSVEAVGAALPELHGAAAKPSSEAIIIAIDVDQIDKNEYQPRTWMEDEDLHEMADSIRTNGVIQPITVRPGLQGRYTLITGERRWRASKIVGLKAVPAIVRQVSAQQAAEMTIIENLQRQDLNCVDQARAFLKMSLEFRLTQEQIGHRVGVSRETVSNYMRLMKLPRELQHMLEKGKLDFSRARVLLRLPEGPVQLKVAEHAVARSLSVEQLSVLVDKALIPTGEDLGEPPEGKARYVDPNVRAAQREMERILGVKVKIRDRRGKGKITLEYSTLEDFDRVLTMLTGKKK